MTAGSELEGGYSRRVLRWVIAVGVGSFLTAILLSAFGPELAPAPTAGTNSFSYSAIGHHGLVEVLRVAGLTVVTRKSPGGVRPGPRWPLLLAEPDGQRTKAPEFARLLAEARTNRAVAVVVLPKWQAFSDGNTPGWVDHVALRAADEIEDGLQRLAPAVFGSLKLDRSSATQAGDCLHTAKNAPFPVHLDPLQGLTADSGFDPVVTCGDAVLIGERAGIWVVADPDLLNNHGLAHDDNVNAAVVLFRDLLAARGVTFEETIHGFTRSDSLLAEAVHFPLWPATLQATLVLGLVLWAGMGRFGAALPAARGLAAGKDVLIDNTAALLSAGGHLADSLVRYHRQSVQAVATALALPTGLPEEELLARLAELGERRGSHHDPVRLARRIERLQGRMDGARQALAIARDLHRWRQEMVALHSSGKSK